MSLFKQDIFIPHVFSFKSKYNNNNNIIAMHICKNLRKKISTIVCISLKRSLTYIHKKGKIKHLKPKTKINK